MNKWFFLAAAAACLLLCAASPVKRSSAVGARSEDSSAATKASRQGSDELVEVVQAPAVQVPLVTAAPAAPVVSSEDDDDDDDYDVGVGDDDDDDDDEEEEEEDDDDEDYFERFFEDILGDDDDDDEPVGAGSTLQAVQGPLIGTAGGSGNAAAPAPAPAPIGNTNNVVTTLEASVIPPESGSEVPVYDEDEDEVTSSGAEDPDTGSFEVDDGRQPDPPAQVVSPAVVAAVAAGDTGTNVVATGDDEEDDEDDDDDLGVGDLTDVDDDDEDEEEDEEEEDEEDEEEETEDEEDDDDDDYDTDVVSSRARALDLNATGRVPASLYVAKYNRYVDSIIDRIKKVLKKSFDPVNVRLHSTTKVNENKNKNKTGPKRPKQLDGSSTKVHALEKQLQEESLLKAQQPSSVKKSEAEPHRRRAAGNKRPAHPNRNNNQNQKNKNKNKSRPRARATLMGLSSMRRDGDVSVNLMSSHTSVRSNFLLGPLVLKVEKEFGRGETKELRSASAVTEEMSGVMNLRVGPGGTASLHNIRVLQPKQVRVESTDNHDKTREFVWRRSSHIAHLVSRKLTAAARSMLGHQKNGQKQTEGSKSFTEAPLILTPIQSTFESR